MKKNLSFAVIISLILSGCATEVEKKHALCMDLSVPMTDQERVDYASALILDLNGDGVKTTDIDKTFTFFDHDGDSIQQQTAFANSHDAFLMRDVNRDGKLISGVDFFGSASVLSNGTTSENGFIALNELDSNQDFQITPEDKAYDELLVWRDTNGSGLIEYPELQRLSSLGIAALNITCLAENRIDEQGNQHKQTSHAQKTSGAQLTLTNVWLKQDLTNTKEDHIKRLEQLRGLPHVRSYGDSGTLHQAMMRDKSGELARLVKAFLVAPSYLERVRLNEKIIFAWTQQFQDYAPYYQSPMDARRMGAMRVFYGRDLPKPNGVGRQFAEIYNKTFDDFAASVFYQLSAKTYLKPYFDSIRWSHDKKADVFVGDYSQTVPLLFELAVQDPENAKGIIESFVLSIRGVNTIKPINIDLLSKALGEFLATHDQATLGAETTNIILSAVYGVGHGADIYRGNRLDNLAFGLGGNDILYGKAGNDTLFGGAGFDELYGGARNDSLNGGMEDDILSGDEGEDFLIGGKGNDILIGGEGYDVYQYFLGDGNDIIVNYDLDLYNRDTLLFGDEVKPSRVSLYQVYDDLQLHLLDTGHVITLHQFFSSSFYQIDQVLFSDGSGWQQSDLVRLAKKRV